MSSGGFVVSIKKQCPLLVALLPLVFLYACAVVLVILSRNDLAGTVHYWEFFVPVVAFIALLSGWNNAYARGHSRLVYLIKQLIVWGILIGGIWLMQTLGVTTGLGADKTAIGLMCILALVSVLVGLQMDLKLLLFGLFLGLCAYLLGSPANTAILAPIGQQVGIMDAPNRPLTMITGIAFAAFIVSAFLFMVVRMVATGKRRAR
jgi:hypothetical protein